MSEAPAPDGEEAELCPLFCPAVGASGIPLRNARCQLDRCERWKDGRCSLIGVLDMMMVQLPPTEDSEPPETSETEEEIAEEVTRVLRRTAETRIYDWLQATGRYPPSRAGPS